MATWSIFPAEIFILEEKKDGTNDQCLTNHMVLGTFMEE